MWMGTPALLEGSTVFVQYLGHDLKLDCMYEVAPFYTPALNKYNT